MRNYMNRHLTTFSLIALVVFCSWTKDPNERHQKNEILVIPGLGLALGMDTIKLSKTRESEIFRLFKIKDTLFKTEHGSACGNDDEGNDVTWDTYLKDVQYDGMTFRFKGYKETEPLALAEIKISDTTHWTVKVNDNIVLGKNMPDIFKYFPKRDSSDAYENYSAHLWSYGIIFYFDETGNNKKLSQIEIIRN